MPASSAVPVTATIVSCKPSSFYFRAALYHSATTAEVRAICHVLAREINHQHDWATEAGVELPPRGPLAVGRAADLDTLRECGRALVAELEAIKEAMREQGVQPHPRFMLRCEACQKGRAAPCGTSDCWLERPLDVCG